ncbi:UNKNOWN [Stylonychia lemnae]|uniref:Uncharacterized protein n=1 Tax=Stylonychia lemnae TaxID=5949 RepID=A0A078APB0_STYLE|nr:UNKNOWN [Stylonychia lemnae]|eukprot:CDW82793.1 UNKNOWN [Stylonychia lemnae]
MQTSTCKDYIQDMNKQSEVGFYDILLFKAMQPYPLRIDMNRIRSQGDYAKNAPDLMKNFVKLLKYTTVQQYMEKTGQKQINHQSDQLNLDSQNSAKNQDLKLGNSIKDITSPQKRSNSRIDEKQQGTHKKTYSHNYNLTPQPTDMEQYQFFQQRKRKNVQTVLQALEIQEPHIVDQSQPPPQSDFRNSKSKYHKYSFSNSKSNLNSNSITVKPFNMTSTRVSQRQSRSNILDSLSPSQSSKQFQSINKLNKPSINTLEDQNYVDTIIQDCKVASNSLKSDSKKLRTKFKSFNKHYYDYKRRLNFNIQQNNQAEEIIPPDMIAIKEQKLQLGGMTQNNKQLKKIVHEINELKQKRVEKQIKTQRLSVNYSKKEIENIINDKEFIDVYKDFNLQYLKECVGLEQEQKKEIKKSVREYHKNSEKQAFKSLRR